MPASTIVEASGADARSGDVLTTQARVDALILAAEAYCRLNGGRYPQSLDAMASPPERFTSAMRNCRLSPESYFDAWSRPIFYGVIEERLVIRSAGVDGRFATADDISIPTELDRYVEEFSIAAGCAEPK